MSGSGPGPTVVRGISDASPERPIAIIGGGPAGLTAAYELSRHGVPVVVFERDAQLGGLARTVTYRGFRFDIGGHRFFTKVPEVQHLWRSMLGPDLLKRPRLSRIFYGGRFFAYPLKPLNVLRNLSPFTLAAVGASYIRVKLQPIAPEVSFADWISNRFGRRLYEMFFKGYTEKVWGIPCTKISAEWAAQRIKGLSLRSALVNAVFPGAARGKGAIKTLIDEFEYPRLGPGMMWERFAERVTEQGGTIHLGTGVVGFKTNGSRITDIVVSCNGQERVQPVAHVISTMPMSALVRGFGPSVPARVATAAAALKYRDFLTVAVIIDKPDVFPDNWIYVHDDSVRIGRIQNYKNWSPNMVPDARYTCLGLEYFVNEGDDLWRMNDEELLAMAARELEAIGLSPARAIVDGTVVRMPKAYPVYESGYRDTLDVIREFTDDIDNLQLVGRNGMHRYNNQDHSMLTALLAVRNLFGATYDLWQVNSDEEYHEQHNDEDAAQASDDLSRRVADLSATQPLVPSRLPSGKS